MAPRRLLVPVANPETADRLLDTAADVALDRDLGLLDLTVVEVPQQLPLAAARDRLDVSDSEQLIQQAVDRAVERGVGVTGRIRFGRDVATSVRRVAADESVAGVLLGWRGRPRRRDIVLGNHLDTVLSAPPCDAIVKRIERSTADVESLLVPVAGGPHTAYAAEVAGAIARTRHADVELLSVVAEEKELDSGRHLLEETTPAVGPVRSVTQTVRTGPVVSTIVTHSSDHDVTVIGASEGGLFRRTLIGTVPEQIARDADGAVLVVKRRASRPRTLLRRLASRFDRVRSLTPQ